MRAECAQVGVLAFIRHRATGRVVESTLLDDVFALMQILLIVVTHSYFAVRVMLILWRTRVGFDFFSQSSMNADAFEWEADSRRKSSRRTRMFGGGAVKRPAGWQNASDRMDTRSASITSHRVEPSVRQSTTFCVVAG